MLVREKQDKKRVKSSIIIIGSFLLLSIGICLLINNYYSNYKEVQQEEIQIDTFINNMSIKEESKLEEQINIQVEDNYIAVIEIPSIDLRKGIYSKNSIENNIEKNVTILKESDMPDTQNGNVVLASHSGPSKIAYFNDLPKLKLNDIAYIYYNGSRFSYKLINIYEVDKTVTVDIVRNTQKNTLTLITCKGKEKKQLVFIFEQ